MATQYVTCPRCSAQNSSLNTTCMTCGSAMPIAPMPMQPMPNYTVKPAGADKKVAAGICGILLGSFGVHKFILGYQQEGVIMLVSWLVGLVLTCGVVSVAVQIVGIIEGIIYLTKSDEEFVQTYVANKKPWF